MTSSWGRGSRCSGGKPSDLLTATFAPERAAATNQVRRSAVLLQPASIKLEGSNSGCGRWACDSSREDRNPRRSSDQLLA